MELKAFRGCDADMTSDLGGPGFGDLFIDQRQFPLLIFHVLQAAIPELDPRNSNGLQDFLARGL